MTPDPDIGLSSLPLTHADFASIMERTVSLDGETDIAVALSGGGDSMALTWLLSEWAKEHGLKLHAITIDHRLRKESSEEASKVHEWVSSWPLLHVILPWTDIKPKTGIQEAAREARYRLMSEYCANHHIRFLCLAHHANDQAETFLFRLAKGSGPDGLAAMSPHQVKGELTLIRPLLEISHQALLATCKKEKIPWVEDITNVSNLYSRVRLRHSMEVLEREGLTLRRLLTLSNRLNRCRNALDYIVDIEWNNSLIENDNNRFVFNKERVFSIPDEILIRLLLRALKNFREDKPYPPSLERLEKITYELLNENLKAATLGGGLIRVSGPYLIVSKEYA